MWQYNNSLYLIHAMRQQEWDRHKYIDKVKTKGGKYRYIYEQPKNRIASKNNKNFSGGSGVLMTYFKLSKVTGIYTVDVNSGKKIDVVRKRLKTEDIVSLVDNYDDIYSTKELASFVKDYFKDYYYDSYGFTDIEKSWKDDVKAMKEYLIEYYKSTPWKFNDFSDDEIVCMFMQTIMQEEGYDINKISLSHYLQSRGYINENRVKNKVGADMSSLNKLSRPMDDDKDMEAVNRESLHELSTDKESKDDYPPGCGFGYSNNCAYCTLAYEMRQRGYDVQASSVCWDTENTVEEIASWYIDKRTGKETEAKYLTDRTTSLLSWKSEIEKGLLSDVDSSNNARGQFLVYWQGGGGHSIVYEVVNGDIQIRDCQINKKYTFDEWANEYSLYITKVYSIRTDNKTISDKALKGVRNSMTWP